MTAIATCRAAENEHRRKWLVRTLVAYEVTTITVCLFVAFTIATAQGGSPLMALPLVLISAAEIMRITLAAWIVRLGWLQKALGLVVLLAISVASAEGLVLAFESAVQARVQNVANAEQRVALAQAVDFH